MRRVACLVVVGLAIACYTQHGGAAIDIEMETRPKAAPGIRLIDLCPGPRDASIVGLVEDSCHRSIEGAEIVVIDLENPVCFYHTKSDPWGTFAIPHIPAESSYQLEVTVKERWCTASASRSVEANAGAITYVHLYMPAPCCQRSKE
jgi:hypothetical protein